MREILFRGKRIDNGEWVYGFYFEAASSLTGEQRHFIQTLKLDGRLDVYYQVAPETVGQYTGLTDVNGEKIFEGDIVRCVRAFNGEPWRGIVTFTVGCFCVKNVDVPAIDLFCTYEVIGNIHDNPELLTEVTK